MVNLTEWIENVKSKETKDLTKILSAIEELKTWDLFEKEYKYTGVFIIGSVVKNELASRIQK